MMIEYLELLSKRVVVIVVEPESITLIPGLADLDEENFMLQIHPDKDAMEIWDPEDCIGVGIESFENDIIRKLEEDNQLRKEYNAEYCIVLKSTTPIL